MKFGTVTLLLVLGLFGGGSVVGQGFLIGGGGIAFLGGSGVNVLRTAQGVKAVPKRRGKLTKV